MHNSWMVPFLCTGTMPNTCHGRQSGTHVKFLNGSFPLHRHYATSRLMVSQLSFHIRGRGCVFNRKLWASWRACGLDQRLHRHIHDMLISQSYDACCGPAYWTNACTKIAELLSALSIQRILQKLTHRFSERAKKISQHSDTAIVTSS